MSTPKLRFKDENGSNFNEPWIGKKLNELVSFKKGKILSKSHLSDNGVPCVLYGQLYTSYKEVISTVISKTDYNSKGLVYSSGGEVLMPCSGETAEDISRASYLPLSGVALGGDLHILYPSKEISGNVLSYILNTVCKRHIARIAQGKTVVHTSSDYLGKIEIFFPKNLEEQHKIAEFLSTVDEKVEALETKLEALNSLKKGFMQRIFSQELRFKDDSGQDFPEWKTKCLGEISERITRKNSNSETDIPLTISAEYGLVNQIEYFNKQIASKDLSKYFLLEKGEFAYNKSYSKGYDFGVIKRLEKYQNGALSSLYICFNVINQDCDFMMYYFDSLKWYKNMPEICQEGARNHGLLNCSVKEFFTIELELPSSKEEQRKIAEFLSAFDEKIEAVKRQVEAMKQVKKGLLQQMFV